MRSLLNGNKRVVDFRDRRRVTSHRSDAPPGWPISIRSNSARRFGPPEGFLGTSSFLSRLLTVMTEDESQLDIGPTEGRRDVASPHYTSRSAFLEFGSTSIKFYVSSQEGENAGQVDREIKIPWELGYDVFQHRRISPSTMARCLSTLTELQQNYQSIPFRTVTAVGTAALREAQNVEVFQRLLLEKLQLHIRIIEGGIEAFLLENGFSGVGRDLPDGPLRSRRRKPRARRIPVTQLDEEDKRTPRSHPLALPAATHARPAGVHRRGSPVDGAGVTAGFPRDATLRPVDSGLRERCAPSSSSSGAIRLISNRSRR